MKRVLKAIGLMSGTPTDDINAAASICGGRDRQRLIFASCAHWPFQTQTPSGTLAKDLRGEAMFGLDWVSIIAAALGGAAGGAVGSLLAAMVQRGVLRTILIVAPIILGVSLVPPLIRPELERLVGAQLRADFETYYRSEITGKLDEFPYLKRIFSDYPDVEVAFKQELRKAYDAGGANGATEAAVGIGGKVLGEVFVRYVPRARADDLVKFAAVMSATLKTLNDKDPEACILFQSGAQLGKPLATSRLTALIGEAGMKSLNDVSNSLVTNAGTQPVAFDKKRAEELAGQIATKYAPLLVGKSGDVASGTRLPADVSEARAACGFSTMLFADVALLPIDDAAAVLRFLMGGGA